MREGSFSPDYWDKAKAEFIANQQWGSSSVCIATLVAFDAWEIEVLG